MTQSLRQLNTLQLESQTDRLIELTSLDELQTLIESESLNPAELLVIGSGSNLLLMPEVQSLVIHNQLKGVQVEEFADGYLITAGSGESWHELVLRTVEQGMYGLENLALIPGSLGAAPIQNIGAYGVEIGGRIHSVEAVHLQTGEQRTFTQVECRFGYRSSIFKSLNNPWFVTEVSIKLDNQFTPILNYGPLKDLDPSSVTAIDVMNRVISIRQSKLPDPVKIGNAGSFFKNPVVDDEQYQELKALYPELIAYPAEGKRWKLAAGWLIDNLGLKGHRIGGAAIHTEQALVIVNKENATGEDVLALAREVRGKVQEAYRVLLENEVGIYGKDGMITL